MRDLFDITSLVYNKQTNLMFTGNVLKVMKNCVKWNFAFAVFVIGEKNVSCAKIFRHITQKITN